jgi:hypothetical protein
VSAPGGSCFSIDTLAAEAGIMFRFNRCDGLNGV